MNGNIAHTAQLTKNVRTKEQTVVKALFAEQIHIAAKACVSATSDTPTKAKDASKKILVPM